MDTRAAALRRALLEDRIDGILFNDGDWSPVQEDLSRVMYDLLADVARDIPEDADAIVRDLRGMVRETIIDRLAAR